MKAKRKVKNLNKLHNNKGQTFVEFLLLFLVLVGMSYALVAGFNRKTGERWTEIINIIASDNINSIRSDIELN